MGDFCFLRQSGPEILPPGRKNPSPEKEIPGPGIFFPSPEFFFPSPFFFRRRLGSPFSRYLELFHRQIPDVNMSAQAPPGLRAPAIPARKQPAPAAKRKPAPLICRHLGFHTLRETAFFAPVPAPCPVQANLRGLQMTKCQNPRQIAKCQIRRNVSAGKQPLLPSEQQRGKTVEALPPHGPRVPTRHFEIGVFDADFVETSQHGLAIPIGNVLLPAH